MPSSKIAVTVRRDRDEVERLWRDRAFHQPQIHDAQMRFVQAPGDRGTEIHVQIDGRKEHAKGKDELRRFKALVETGEIPRSDASPGGVSAKQQLHQRPAQPVEA
jgi:hypothetical protein